MEKKRERYKTWKIWMLNIQANLFSNIIEREANKKRHRAKTKSWIEWTKGRSIIKRDIMESICTLNTLDGRKMDARIEQGDKDEKSGKHRSGKRKVWACLWYRQHTEGTDLHAAIKMANQRKKNSFCYGLNCWIASLREWRPYWHIIPACGPNNTIENNEHDK